MHHIKWLTACILGMVSVVGAQPTKINIALYAANPEAGTPPEDWEVYSLVKDRLGIGFSFTMVPSGADGDNKIMDMANSGTLPDLFEIRNPNVFNKLVQQGKIGAVDGLMSVMPRRTQQRYSNSKRNALVTLDGKMYGLQEPVTLSRQYGVWIRQDWLDALNLQAPGTLEEFLAVAKAFTEQDPDGNGKNDTYGYGGVLDYDTAGILPGMGLGNHFQWIYGAYGVAGTWNYANKSSFKANIKNPNYRKATDFVRKLVPYMDPQWSSMKRAELRTGWQQGRYGMFFESVGGLQSGMRTFYGNLPNASLALLNPTQGPEGKASMGTYSSAGWLFVVSKKTVADPDKSSAVARFLEWANSGEGYLALGWGRKDIDYIYARGVPTANPAAVAAERGRRVQMRWLAYDGSQKELKGRYPMLVLPNGKKYAMHTYMQKVQRQGKWIDRTGDLIVKPASNQDAIEKYISSSLLEFVTGRKPLVDTSWSNFMDGLDNFNFDSYENDAKNTLKAAGYIR